MRHPHANRRQRNISLGEHYSYRHSSANKIGANALRVGFVVSKPGHRVGLQKNPGEPLYDNPNDFTRLQAERLATDILSSITTNRVELTNNQIGKQLLESIDEEYDSDEIIALKKIGAKICGFDEKNTDYQQVISTLDATMSADDLRDFITYLYEWSHDNDTESAEQYVDEQMNELSGFRVEASFARLAEIAGFTFRPATRYEDHRGLDFMVENVPFDLKSSERIAKYHVKKHKKDTYRINAVRFVPPITSADFEGRLVVPYERAMTIVQDTNFKNMVTESIQKYKDTQNLTAAT